MVLSGTILLNNIVIKAATLYPDDAQLFAQLTVDGRVIKRTEPVNKDAGHSLWLLNEGFTISASTPYFTISVLHGNDYQDSRLLGSIELTSEKIVAQFIARQLELSQELTPEHEDAPQLHLTLHLLVIPSCPALEAVSIHPPSVTHDVSLSSNSDDSGSLDDLALHFLQARAASQSNDIMDPVDIAFAKIVFGLEAEQRSPTLNMHGTICAKIYDKSQDMKDLNRAIFACNSAVQLSPDSHQDYPAYLIDTGILLKRRFESLGDPTDLDKSISMFEEALRLTPVGHPNKSTLSGNLGLLFSNRFALHGESKDIDKSISLLEDALHLTPDGHPNKPSLFDWLGTSFTSRFRLLDELHDLDKSISSKEEAVKLTLDDHPNKPGLLGSLGLLLFHRFQRLDKVTDINKSVRMLQDAIRLAPDGHPEKHIFLSNIGLSLLRRFERFGDLTDIDKSVIRFKEAIQYIPDDDPKRALVLGNLGTAYLRRFERLGELNDCDMAIMMLEEAIKLIPGDHTNKPGLLSNLGHCYFRHFDRVGVSSDLDKSISMLEDAVLITPDDHPSKPMRLINLGNSYALRFKDSHEPHDINKSISVSEDAVRLTPGVRPQTPTRLSNLGSSLLYRFEQFSDPLDMERSIERNEEAVRLIPDGHPDMPTILTNLGDSFLRRFECLSDDSALHKAISSYSTAARSSTGAPWMRFQAALNWAQCAQRAQHSSLLEASTCAFRILPQLVWLGLPIHDRHRVLAHAGTAITDAAATAIKFGNHTTAIEWLDQGRSFVWGQLLRLRTPVDNLREVQPELAEQFSRISMDLEQASARDDPQAGVEEVAQKHRLLALEWEELVEKIRTVKGFETFLLPKSLSDLTPAAQSGPVVVLNISKLRCDALILRPNHDDVLHVPLSTLTYDHAQTLREYLIVSLQHNRCSSRYGEPWNESAIQGLETVLSELWIHVVKPVIDGLGILSPPAGDLPRIWWCPTGPLAFLPIHAAGLYHKTESGFRCSDFFVSSYTPTLSALITTRQQSTQQHFQLLAVAQPSAPGSSPLPGTQDELHRIQRCAKNLTIQKLVGSEATMIAVMDGMKKSSWVHLACHGVQDMVNPTESALLLYDGRLKLSEITKMSLPNANLAFLSACQTATGCEELPEEAIHLAGGMLLAGYRGVIATLWSIGDMDAPLVAEKIYKHLLKDQQPDHTRAAHALHHAIRREIDEKRFTSWVPFIHVGA